MSVPGWNEFVALIEGFLVFLAQYTGSSAVAIIILTIIVKLATVPLTLSSLRSAKRMQEIQPLVKELQKKYGNDRQLLSAETMKLYQQYGVNPLASCLPIIIQMPIFFGLYGAIINIATKAEYQSMGFSVSFLWLADISKPDVLFHPLRILPIVVTLTQFIQQRMAMPQRIPGQQMDEQQQMMNTTMQIMPLMIGFFAWDFASGAVIYWVTQNIFSMIQQFFITGFGSLRDLPGMKWLPVPKWAVVVPPSGSAGHVVVTKGGGWPAGAESTPGGLMGRLYQQISRKVEQSEQTRADRISNETAGTAEKRRTTPPDGGSGKAEPPARRSARRRSR